MPNSNYLPIVIQEQIDRALADRTLEIRRLEDRITGANLNARSSMSALAEHNRQGLDAHGIRALIVDVINENLLFNPGMKLNEQIESLPDGWEIDKTEFPDATIKLDDACAKYGTHSLKISGKQTQFGVRTVSVYQYTKPGSVIPEGTYSFAFFYTPVKDGIRIKGSVSYFDENGALLTSYPFDDVDMYDDTTLTIPFGAFARHKVTTEAPEFSSYAKVQVDVEFASEMTEEASVWLDYFTFNVGFEAHKPGELTEGILRTEHISTVGLDAKVIKTGDITITNSLKLVTEGGDVRLHYDEDNFGNVLEFWRSDTHRIVAIGKYGPLSGDYGFLIQDEGGNDRFRVDASGNIFTRADIEADTITVKQGNVGDYIKFHGDNSQIEILAEDKITSEVILGRHGDKSGIFAGYNPITDEYNFSVTSQGQLFARDAVIEGTLVVGEGSVIAGFEVGDNFLKSVDGKIRLDSTTARITLSPEEHYATLIQPDGIFGKVLYWQVSEQNFDPEQVADNYFIKSLVVQQGATAYNIGEDYEWSPHGGVIRTRGSSIPLGATDLTFTYVVYDGRTSPATETEYTETNQSFTPTVRSSAIITDDTLLDATFVRNLIVGAAQIGHGVITSAHINSLVADKIDSGTLHIREGLKISAGEGDFVIDDVSMRLVVDNVPKFVVPMDGQGLFIDGTVHMREGWIASGVTIGGTGPSYPKIASEDDVEDAKQAAKDYAEEAEENVKAYAQKKVTYSPDAPLDPEEDDLWYDETNKELKRYIGSSWVIVSDETASHTAADTAKVAGEDAESIKSKAAAGSEARSFFNQSGQLTKDIDAAIANILAGANETVRIDGQGIRVFDPSNSSKYIQINSGGIVLSDVSGVPAAITPQGIHAEAITTGFLSADRIAVGSLHGNRITANSLGVGALNFTQDGRIKGDVIRLDGNVEVTGSFKVSDANIANVSADKITAGEINASLVKLMGSETGGSLLLQGNILEATGIDGHVTTVSPSGVRFENASGGGLYFRGAKVGSAIDGEEVSFPEFKTEPKIVVSPINLRTYDTSETGANQRVEVGARNVRMKSGVWVADIVCRLYKEGQTVSGALSSTLSTGQSFTSDPSDPSNQSTTSIGVSGSLRAHIVSQHGFPGEALLRWTFSVQYRPVGGSWSSPVVFVREYKSGNPWFSPTHLQPDLPFSYEFADLSPGNYQIRVSYTSFGNFSGHWSIQSHSLRVSRWTRRNDLIIHSGLAQYIAMEGGS